MTKRTDQELLEDILRNARSVSSACFAQCEAVDLADDVLEWIERRPEQRYQEAEQHYRQRIAELTRQVARLTSELAAERERNRPDFETWIMTQEGS